MSAKMKIPAPHLCTTGRWLRNEYQLAMRKGTYLLQKRCVNECVECGELDYDEWDDMPTVLLDAPKESAE